MSVHIPTAGYGRGRRSRLTYDRAPEPGLALRAGARSARPGYDPLSRWLAVGALALVTILFLLIVLQ